jgi:hypothetical protein
MRSAHEMRFPRQGKFDAKNRPKLVHKLGEIGKIKIRPNVHEKIAASFSAKFGPNGLKRSVLSMLNVQAGIESRLCLISVLLERKLNSVYEKAKLISILSTMLRERNLCIDVIQGTSEGVGEECGCIHQCPRCGVCRCLSSMRHPQKTSCAGSLSRR